MVKSNRKILHKLLLVGAELLVLAHCKDNNDKNSQVKVSGIDKRIHNYIDDLRDCVSKLTASWHYKDNLEQYNKMNQIFKDLFYDLKTNDTSIPQDQDVQDIVETLKKIKDSRNEEEREEREDDTVNLLKNNIVKFLDFYGANTQSEGNENSLSIDQWLNQFEIYENNRETCEDNSFYESLKHIKIGETFERSEQIQQLIENFRKSKENKNFDLVTSNSNISHDKFQNFIETYFANTSKNIFVSNTEPTNRNILEEWFQTLSDLANNPTKCQCKILTTRSLQRILMHVGGQISNGNNIVNYICQILVPNDKFTKKEMFEYVTPKFGNGSITKDASRQAFCSFLKDVYLNKDQRDELQRIFGDRGDNYLKSTAISILKSLETVGIVTMDDLKNMLSTIDKISPDEFVQFIKVIYEKSEDHSKNKNIIEFINYVDTYGKLPDKLESKHLGSSEGGIIHFFEQKKKEGHVKVQDLFTNINLLNCIHEFSITDTCTRDILNKYREDGACSIQEQDLVNIIYKSEKNSLSKETVNVILALTNDPVKIFNDDQVLDRVSPGALSIYQVITIVNKLIQNDANDNCIIKLFGKISATSSDNEVSGFDDAVLEKYKNNGKLSISDIIFNEIFEHCNSRSKLFLNPSIIDSLNNGSVAISYFNKLWSDPNFMSSCSDKTIENFSKLVLKIAIPYTNDTKKAINFSNSSVDERTLIQNILEYLNNNHDKTSFSDNVKKVFDALRNHTDDANQKCWIKFNLAYFELFENYKGLKSDALSMIIKQCLKDDGASANDREYLKICNILINISEGVSDMFEILDNLFSTDSNSLNKIFDDPTPKGFATIKKAAASLQQTKINGTTDKSIFDLISDKIGSKPVTYANNVQYAIAYIIQYLGKAGQFNRDALYSFVERLGKKLPLSVLNGTRARNSSSMISCICPEQKDYDKTTNQNENIKEFSQLLYNTYLTDTNGPNYEKNDKATPSGNNGLDAGIIAEIFKKFSNKATTTNNEELTYTSANIVKLDNGDNTAQFTNNAKKEFANVMLLLVKHDELLKLGKEIYQYNNVKGIIPNLQFDTGQNGSWQFFRNILNINTGPKNNYDYEEFLCFLHLFKDKCENIFDVRKQDQWDIVNDFYKNWTSTYNIDVTKTNGVTSNDWSHLCSLAHIVNMNDKIMCPKAWKDILKLFNGKSLTRSHVYRLFNLNTKGTNRPLQGIDMSGKGAETLIEGNDTFFTDFFDILDPDVKQFIFVIGNTQVIKKIIGNIGNNDDICVKLGLNNYLTKLRDYPLGKLKNNLTPDQMQSILDNHDIWKNTANKINDDVTNKILDLVDPSKYNDLFKTGGTNFDIQNHMNSAIVNGGTLNHKTISRIITTGTNITHENKNILAQYYSTSDTDGEKWLQAIHALFQKEKQIQMIETNSGQAYYLQSYDNIKGIPLYQIDTTPNICNIAYIIQYMQKFVSLNVKQYQQDNPNNNNSIQELFTKLKGTTWSPMALYQVCDLNMNQLLKIGTDASKEAFINKIASDQGIQTAFLEALSDTECKYIIPYIDNKSVDYNGSLTPKNFVDLLLQGYNNANKTIINVDQLVGHLSNEGWLENFVNKFKTNTVGGKIEVKDLFDNTIVNGSPVNNVFKGQLSYKSMHELVKQCDAYTLDKTKVNGNDDKAILTSILMNGKADSVYNVLKHKSAKSLFSYITTSSVLEIKKIQDAIDLACHFDDMNGNKITNISKLAADLESDYPFCEAFINSLAPDQQTISVVLGPDGLGKPTGTSGQLTAKQAVNITCAILKQNFNKAPDNAKEALVNHLTDPKHQDDLEYFFKSLKKNEDTIDKISTALRGRKQYSAGQVLKILVHCSNFHTMDYKHINSFSQPTTLNNFSITGSCSINNLFLMSTTTKQSLSSKTTMGKKSCPATGIFTAWELARILAATNKQFTKKTNSTVYQDVLDCLQPEYRKLDIFFWELAHCQINPTNNEYSFSNVSGLAPQQPGQFPIDVCLELAKACHTVNAATLMNTLNGQTIFTTGGYNQSYCQDGARYDNLWIGGEKRQKNLFTNYINDLGDGSLTNHLLGIIACVCNQKIGNKTDELNFFKDNWKS